MTTAILYTSPHHHNTEKTCESHRREVSGYNSMKKDIQNAVQFYENLLK